MAKTGGGVRTLKTNSREYKKRLLEVEALRESGKYSHVLFSSDGGGFLAIEKSATKHKPEEVESGMKLANKGYKVFLTDEAGEIKRAEGLLFDFRFEQRTPDGNSASNIRNAINHALEKRASIAVIYMKHNKHTRESVEAGIKQYHEKSRYKLKQIIIVTEDGRIHKHK